MDLYRVKARSRNEIRRCASIVRRAFGYDDKLFFCVVELLDRMAAALDDFSYEVLLDNLMAENEHAFTDMTTGKIFIKETVFNNACNNKGRDRMTIAHEIAHYFLHFGKELVLCRGNTSEEIKPYESPEWQAKCFAGELLIPRELTRGMSAFEVHSRCGVSLKAANYQLGKY